MNQAQAAGRLRRFLLWLTAGSCLAIPAELLLSEHFEETLQLLPFALCALGVGAAAWVLWRPSRAALLGLRASMVLLALGGAWGSWAHLQGNIELELEIRPTEGLSDVIVDALMGASPLLAPGAMILVAAIAIVATYQHPVLNPEPEHQ